MQRNPEIQIKLGEKVRALRKDGGISSQESLARKCGLDRTYIGGVERGERNVSIQNLEKIAKAFGITVSELLKGV